MLVALGCAVDAFRCCRSAAAGYEWYICVRIGVHLVRYARLNEI